MVDGLSSPRSLCILKKELLLNSHACPIDKISVRKKKKSSQNFRYLIQKNPEVQEKCIRIFVIALKSRNHVKVNEKIP